MADCNLDNTVGVTPATTNVAEDSYSLVCVGLPSLDFGVEGGVDDDSVPFRFSNLDEPPIMRSIGFHELEQFIVPLTFLNPFDDSEPSPPENGNPKEYQQLQMRHQSQPMQTLRPQAQQSHKNPNLFSVKYMGKHVHSRSAAHVQSSNRFWSRSTATKRSTRIPSSCRRLIDYVTRTRHAASKTSLTDLIHEDNK